MKEEDQLTFREIGEIFHISSTLAHRLYGENKSIKVDEEIKKHG